MRKPLFALLGALILLGGCTGGKDGDSLPATEVRTPEETVKAFVKLSSQAKELKDKEKLEKLCHGELRRAFDRMTKEMFRISYLKSNVKIVDLTILKVDKEEDVSRATIRYQISIQNDQGTEPTQEINQREVELAFVDGNWFIDSIRAVGTDEIAFTRGMMF